MTRIVERCCGHRRIFAHQSGDRVCDLARRHDSIDLYVGQRIGGHSGIQRLRGVLDYRGAAVGFDHGQTGGAIVAHPGQDHPHHRSRLRLRVCGAAKQNVDCWPVSIFPRAQRQAGAAVGDDKVAIRGGDEDFAGVEFRPVRIGYHPHLPADDARTTSQPEAGVAVSQ